MEWRKLRSVLAEKADAAACSMADYTVSVRPRAAWPDGFDRSLDTDEKEEEFIEDLKKRMEKYGPVATIDGKPAIWLAFAEKEIIGLSAEKCDQLIDLEEALAKATREYVLSNLQNNI